MSIENLLEIDYQENRHTLTSNYINFKIMTPIAAGPINLINKYIIYTIPSNRQPKTNNINYHYVQSSPFSSDQSGATSIVF